MTTTVCCGQCDLQLEDQYKEIPRVPCPQCGSEVRHFGVQIEEQAAVHVSLSTKLRRGGQTGRPAVEGKSGDDYQHSTGKWLTIKRVIDRENNLYREKLIDPATGKVVRDVQERLSDHTHRGHGKKPPAGA